MGFGYILFIAGLFVVIAGLQANYPVVLWVGVILLVICIVATLIKVMRDDSLNGQLREEHTALTFHVTKGPRSIWEFFRKSRWRSPLDRSNEKNLENNHRLEDGHFH